MKIISLLLLFIVTLPMSFAFNNRKCMQIYKYTNNKKRPPWQYTLGATTAPTSIFQFTSSTGSCSAMGATQNKDAEIFYAFNSKKVLEDIAKGGGDYITALSQSWGCSKTDTDYLILAQKQSYSKLTSMSLEKQYLYLEKSQIGICAH